MMASTFQGFGRFEIPDRGIVVTVPLDQETTDFQHLIEKIVIISGDRHVCRGVERKLHAPPWRQGEMIGLPIS